MAVEKYINRLREIKKHSKSQYQYHKKKYKKNKNINSYTNLSITLLNSVSISLLIIGILHPPIIIASGACSGLSFIIQELQKTYYNDNKVGSHKITYSQYYDIYIEVTNILDNNGLTEEQYKNLINNLQDRLEIIRDSQQI